MFKTISFFSLLSLLAGCSYFDVNLRESNEGPIISRAVFSNSTCPSAPDAGAIETGLEAAAISWAVVKTAEVLVGAVSGAVSDAAAADRDTITVTGQNPDYLFKVQEDKAQMRGCLFVVVAPRIKNGEFCPDGIGNWYNGKNCNTAPRELRDKWEEWSLGVPTFFAEIGMVRPEGGPATTVIPKAYKVYYPKPISTMSPDKVKGFSVLVTASKPTKSTKAAGDTVMEVFLGGDGVTPKTVSEDGSLQTSGLWVTVPSPEGGLGSSFAGPVNLTVTVAETPHATEWLQSVAKLVKENEQKAKDSIIASVDPSAKEKFAQEKITNSLTRTVEAAKACSAFSKQVEQLITAGNALKSTKGTAEEMLRMGYALDEECANTMLAKRTTEAAWVASGKTDGLFCGRQVPVDEEITKLCSH